MKLLKFDLLEFDSVIRINNENIEFILEDEDSAEIYHNGGIKTSVKINTRYLTSVDDYNGRPL